MPNPIQLAADATVTAAPDAAVDLAQTIWPFIAAHPVAATVAAAVGVAVPVLRVAAPVLLFLASRTKTRVDDKLVGGLILLTDGFSRVLLGKRVVRPVTVAEADAELRRDVDIEALVDGLTPEQIAEISRGAKDAGA